jgi:hypothetical protein
MERKPTDEGLERKVEELERKVGSRPEKIKVNHESDRLHDRDGQNAGRFYGIIASLNWIVVSKPNLC